jgi:hypothetical protein
VSEAFTAYCACPRCESFACHPMRNPKPKPSAEVMAHWEANHVEIHRWGVGKIGTRPPMPIDESGFDVIRQCKCGFEWGQK